MKLKLFIFRLIATGIELRSRHATSRSCSVLSRSSKFASLGKLNLTKVESFCFPPDFLTDYANFPSFSLISLHSKALMIHFLPLFRRARAIARRESFLAKDSQNLRRKLCNNWSIRWYGNKFCEPCELISLREEFVVISQLFPRNTNAAFLLEL